MTKYEFLNRLQEALEGEVTQGIINENINYYSNYIDGEMSKGKSEAEILQQLGEPRLIAKTIIETDSLSQNNRTYTYSNESEETSDEEPNRKGFNAGYNGQNGWDIRFGNLKLNTWYGKMILIILIVIIICIVGQIAIAILPIILPIIIIFWLLSFFTGGRR